MTTTTHQAAEPDCSCETCEPNVWPNLRFIVCAICGNKRCPHANDHRNACTNSNAVGQPGSSWEHVKPFAPPPQEAQADERALFEAWLARKERRPLYWNTADAMFVAWQARAALAAQPAQEGE